MKHYITIVLEFGDDDPIPKLGPYTKLMGGKVYSFADGDRMSPMDRKAVAARVTELLSDFEDGIGQLMDEDVFYPEEPSDAPRDKEKTK